MRIEISTGEPVSVDLGGLRFNVRRRQIGDDGGTSIEVYADVEGETTQVLRFDCFRKDPHYHMPPSAPGQLGLNRDEVGDGLGWALEQTRTNIPAMLRKAGFDELADSVDADAFTEGWKDVQRAVETAPEPSETYIYDTEAQKPVG